MGRHIRIGVDTGGTFTDFIFSIDGKIHIKKIPSTPANPSLAILQGISEYLHQRSLLQIIHGSTVATNALLQRSGGKIALLTTRGFEDVLSIGRQTRRQLYRLKGERPMPLVDRRHCFGLTERTDASGSVAQSISTLEMEKMIRMIGRMKFEAVAVSLIHSYANGANEKIVGKALKKKSCLISLSSEILPEHREYERTAVTAVNAYLMPVVTRYLKDQEDQINGADLRIMQSNEGHMSTGAAKAEPIRTALSGPAGGVVAAFHAGKSAGFNHLISFDMGGTSTDVSLIDHQIRRTHENVIGDFPIRLPIIDIHTVGAGGGSIAHVDRGGALRVGPRSAGADPGPACYGRDKLPTVTDANMVLGRLVPELFLGGDMRIYPEKSYRAIQSLAKKIGKSVTDTAAGVIAVANASMEKAIRVISVERGFDPRRFALFSFGGAGGLHAAALARELKMARVIVPKNAGVFSALGLLLADSVKDYSQSVLQPHDSIRSDALERRFRVLEQRGLRDARRDGFEKKDVRLLRFADLRYAGQSFEITVPFRSRRSCLAAFRKAHQALYAYHHRDQPVEIVNIRVKATGTGKKIRLKRFAPKGRQPDHALFKKQDLIFQGGKYRAPVYIRSNLEAGNRIKGPALIADDESTTFLPPGHRLEVDRYLNLVIKI